MYKSQLEKSLISKSEVKLVEPRDQECWTNPTYNEDKKYKKKFNGNHAVNYMLNTYLQQKDQMQKYSNIHLTVGRQRL